MKKIITSSALLLTIALSAFKTYRVQEAYTSSCGANWNITVYASSLEFASWSIDSMEAKCENACDSNATLITQPSMA